MARINSGALFARSGGLYPPPSVIKSWPRPNHTDPETRGLAVPVILIALLIFTFIVYSARMWARLVVAKNAGLDDMLISIAMILVVGSTISVILGKYSIIKNPKDRTDTLQVFKRMASNGILGIKLDEHRSLHDR